MAKPLQLPSGKWRMQIRKNGVYRNKTFSTRKAAAEWGIEITRQVDQINAGGYSQPTGLTLSKLIDLYFESPVGKQSKSTKRFYIEQIRKSMGSVLIADLNHVNVRDFVDQREADGVQGSTIAGQLSYLSVVLKWAKQVKRIDCNPAIATDARATLSQRGLSTRSVERDRVPAPMELERLYAHYREHGAAFPMEPIIKFALASAMRQSEMMSMTAEMVDAEARTVTMRRKDPRRKDQNIMTIPMPPAAMAIIKDRLKEFPTGRLFPYNGKCVSANFKRTCEKLGIEDLRFHDLRHAATVALFRAGLDIPRVAMITGHRSWENLKRYTNLDATDVHSILDGVK
jgi:integrase